MGRPNFTKEEEALISLVKLHEHTPVNTLLRWLPWLLISGGVFFYGVYTDVKECAFVGFMLVFYLLCRMVWYQVKPSWQLKPIIEKFEAACEESSNQNVEPIN